MTLDDMDKRDYQYADSQIRLAVAIAAPVFHMQGWSYRESAVPPTNDQIESTIEGLVNSCLKATRTLFTGTGRFMVHGDRTGVRIYLELAEIDLEENEE